jgi:hypothetical protein
MSIGKGHVHCGRFVAWVYGPKSEVVPRSAEGYGGCREHLIPNRVERIFLVHSMYKSQSKSRSLIAASIIQSSCYRILLSQGQMIQAIQHWTFHTSMQSILIVQYAFINHERVLLKWHATHPRNSKFLYCCKNFKVVLILHHETTLLYHGVIY